MKAQFLTPTVTLFKQDGTLDIEANKKLYDFLLGKGLDGLVIMGSTGEFFSMTMEMQKQLIDLAADYVKDRTRVLVGVSRMVADETVELANYAYDKGITEVMVVSPYYFKLTQEALEAYFDQVAEGTRASIFLYNFPDRTGHDLSAELVLRLAKKHKNIVGIKDTVTEMGHTDGILGSVLAERPDFQVFSGYDNNLAHNILGGGVGVIGGLSHLIPDVCVNWTRALREENVAEIARWQQVMNRALAIYDVAMPFVPTVKRGLQLMGLDVNDTCTAPIPTLNKEQENKLAAILKELGAL